MTVNTEPRSVPSSAFNMHAVADRARMVYVLRLFSPRTSETPVQVQSSKNTGYRTFLDARGRVWEVWMVHPSSIERRRMQRRSPVENAVFLIEQRVLGDRRAHTGVRAAVASEYSAGW